MTAVFLDVVNRGISASWLILAVLLLRLVLKKAPKWVNVLLWGIVALRLICPVSIESSLSLVPSAQTIGPEIMMDWTPEIDTGVPALNEAVNPVILDSFAPHPAASANPLQIYIPVCAALWLVGMAGLLGYTVVSYWLLRRRLATAVRLRYNIFQSEAVTTPFVLGIFKPRVYLPYSMSKQEIIYVVAHEKAHIRRRDHWWKPLGFLLVAIHWFNPLLWLAYKLFCRDIELACDERVIDTMNQDQRADYAQALLSCSSSRRVGAACPLAFGEVGVKSRIRSVLDYRKPSFWMLAVALILCAVVCICFLTDPKEEALPLEQPEATESIQVTELVDAGVEAVQDLAYFLELAVPEEEFQEMDAGKQEQILSEYGNLLEDFALLARETRDGSLFYIAGYYAGEEGKNPFSQLYGSTQGYQEETTQILYWEEDFEYASATKTEPEDGYVLRNSLVHYSRSNGYVLIHGKEAGWTLGDVFNKYISAKGRGYLLDAAERGIALATPEKGPYLEVYLISPRWGEISEQIPLSEEQVAQILSEERQTLEEGYGFSAGLYLGENSTINVEEDALRYTEFRGIPQTVLDLAAEKCGYVFARPEEIRSEIVEARLDCDWLEEPRYATDLAQLQDILTHAEFGYVGGCGYGARLTIQMADGSSMVLYKGTDGCDTMVFGSYGGYFIGDAGNTEFWELFGLDAGSKQPIG